MSTATIDERILASVNTSWQKIAMVIAIALTDPDLNVYDEQEIADRVHALIANGQFELQGNSQDWRHSEVRRKAIA